MVLLNLVNNAIVAYQNSVSIRAAIHKLVCCVQMHRVQRANAVICKRVSHIKRALCAAPQTVNAICPNIVLANQNIVQMIILSEIQNCAVTERLDAIKDYVVHAMINVNCYGDHPVNRQNSAMRKIQREHVTVIAGMIDSPIPI